MGEHFGERLKNAKENNYLDSSDDGVEDISDDDLEQPDIEYGDEFKGKEDEDLRLTSTDDDNDEKIGDISGDEGIERSSRQKIKRESKDELIRDTKRERDMKGEEKKNGEANSSNLYENLPDPKNQGSCDDESDNSSVKTKKRRKKDKKEKKKKKKKEKERDRSEKDD